MAVDINLVVRVFFVCLFCFFEYVAHCANISCVKLLIVCVDLMKMTLAQ